MKEGETVNENETVNQSQSANAGGSGDSPDKLVADHVDRLWEHIAADGYDLLADVAVESLTRNGDVPPDAYLRSVKMSWCLHRAATYYARQYSVERLSADFARGDAQFEHSLRAQAEREAEKLKADLAQSALLVENLRLRIEEADTANQELRQKLDTAEAAMLEQQQQKRELRNEEQSVQALWGETRRRCEDLETLVADLQTANAAAEAALLEQQQRNEALVTQGSQQRMKIAELQRQVEAVKTQELDGKTQELQAGYTPPEGWRLLQTGEPLQNGDQFIPESGAVEVLRDVKTELAQPTGHYIRQIEPEVVQPLMLQDADAGIRMLRQCNQNQYEKIVSMREELNQVKAELAGAIQSRDLLAETNREQAGKIEHLQRQVEALTVNGGDDSRG